MKQLTVATANAQHHLLIVIRHFQNGCDGGRGRMAQNCDQCFAAIGGHSLHVKGLFNQLKYLILLRLIASIVYPMSTKSFASNPDLNRPPFSPICQNGIRN